jgi:hypothetical protein
MRRDERRPWLGGKPGSIAGWVKVGGWDTPSGRMRPFFIPLKRPFDRSVPSFTPCSSAELILSYIVIRMTVQRALQTVKSHKST